MTKRFFPLFLSAALALPALADDFGIWSGVAVQKSLGHRFSVDASLGFRAQDKLRQATRWDMAVGADYDLTRWLSVGAGYTYIYGRKGEEAKTDFNKSGAFNGYNVDHGYWRSRHRATVDLTGKWRVGRFTLGIRERYQFTHYNAATTLRDRYRQEIPEDMAGGWSGDKFTYGGKTFGRHTLATDDKPAKDRHLLRSRFGIDYNIRHCPFTPYASFEFHNDLQEGLDLDKTRLTLGTEWKISKHHRLDLSYVMQNSHDSDDNDNGLLHALSVSYKFKF